jgi:non-ribosomal peptide synthetase component F
VREASLGAFAHQGLPFDKLVEELRPERKLTHNPLVQVLFVMQNTPRMATEFGGLKLGPLGVSSTSRFDLVLFINDPDRTPYATWMYNPNLFDPSTIARIAALYEVLLMTVATDPETKLNALRDVLSEAEKQQRQTEQTEFQQISLQKLKKIKRKAVSEFD